MAAAADAALSRLAKADAPTAYRFDVDPPMDTSESFVKWMVANRGEDPKYLTERWQRYEVLLRNRDLRDTRNKRAFLMTPREEFVLKQNLGRAYDHAFLDI